MMRLLKEETTVPVPEVFDFSSTTDNVLNCPYIMINFVPGTSLYDTWFGMQLKGQDPDLVHRHRVKALHGIASAMAQIASYTFRQSGSPKFGADGSIVETAPTRYLDQQSMLDRWFVHGDPDEDPIFVQIEPSSDSKHHYTFSLDLLPAKENDPDGLVLMLRQLIQWLPEPALENPFVLAHPDFDLQNFLVSKDGELQAIIDWDGICAVPCGVGNESYPGWLTRDWDPGMYGYKESMDQGIEPEGVWENSPAELSRYGGIYRDLLHQCLRRETTENRMDTTSMSLIAENLAIAARDPAYRGGILEKMMREITTGVDGQFEMNFLDLAARFSGGDVDDGLLESLKTGFTKLLERAHSL